MPRRKRPLLSVGWFNYLLSVINVLKRQLKGILIILLSFLFLWIPWAVKQVGITQQKLGKAACGTTGWRGPAAFPARTKCPALLHCSLLLT